MALVTITQSANGKDPFANFKKGKVQAVINKYAKEALKLFADHGRNYTGGIDEKIERRSGEEVVVGSEDERVIWVNLGTPDHFVAPRNAPAMVYSTNNYVYKTAPGTIASKPGGRDYSSNIVKRTDRYKISGIEARDAHKAIAKEIEGPFVAELRRAIGV